MRSLALMKTIALVCGLPALLGGCGEDTERPSEVHTLRVLAVRADTPYARPGASAKLSLLGYDGSPRRTRPDGSKRQVSTLWIGGCNNPPGDSYSGCMQYLQHAIEQLGEEHLATSTLPAEAPPGVFGWGQTFTAQVPPDIVSSRRVAEGVVHPYGVQLVFFAHCGGVLRRESGDGEGFPLGCFDAESGERLGRDDFEYGFYPLFVYDSVTNQNPELSLQAFDGKSGNPECSDSAPCSSGYHCGSEQRCIPAVNRCRKPDKDDCPAYRLAVQVPRDSVERAVLARIPDADAPRETLWVSYYASDGSFEQDASMIHEPQTGFEPSAAGLWRANVKSSGEVRLWIVARDNRNGVAWIWQDVWVN